MTLTRAARGVGLFVVLAAGLSFIASVLIGGGYGRSSGERKTPNTDPRSVLLETVIIEHTDGAPWMRELGLPGVASATLSRSQFDALVAGAREAESAGLAAVRAPSALVQHNGQATMRVETPEGEFTVSLSPAVLKDDVIRVALGTSWEIDAPESGLNAIELSTEFTCKSSGVMLDLAGVTDNPAGGTVLAVRPTLFKYDTD